MENKKLIIMQMMSMYIIRRRQLIKRKLALLVMMLNLMQAMRASLRLIISLQRSEFNERQVWKYDRSTNFWEQDVPKMSDQRFRYNFRLSRQSFKKLCQKMKVMEKRDTNFRRSIPLEKRVGIAMYALGSSSEYRTVSQLFGVGLCTVANIMLEFCHTVCERMSEEISFYPPTAESVRAVVEGFAAMGFPQCCGAIDGCHIEMQPPKEDAVDYYNYKGWYSIVLLAACDHRCKFTYVNIGSAGRNNDSYIFENSSLKRFHEKSQFFAEQSKVINNKDIPLLLIGDSAFSMSRYMMKPFPYTVQQPEFQKTFNYRLSKCRRVIENAFGQLKARFRKIGRGLQVSAKNCSIIIHACCILHNFLKSEKDEVSQHWLEENSTSQTRSQPTHSTCAGNNDDIAKEIREAIAYSFQFAADDVDGDGEFGDGGIGDCEVGDGKIGDGRIGDGRIGDGRIGDGGIGVSEMGENCNSSSA